MKFNYEIFYFCLPIEKIGRIIAVVYIVLGFIAAIISGSFSVLVSFPILMYQETTDITFTFYTYFIYAILIICAGFILREGIPKKNLLNIKVMLITQSIGILLAIITFIVLHRSNLVKILTPIMATFLIISLFYTYCLYIEFEKIIETNKKNEEKKRKQSDIVPVHKRRITVERKMYNESRLI